MSLVKTTKNATTFPSVLSDFFDADKFFSPRWLGNGLEQTLPAVNIKENGKEFNIHFAVPGYNKNDFKVNVDDNVLTISAEKQEEKKEEKDRFTRKEFSYNSFSRSFTLPHTVDGEKIDAKYNDGILKLSIPKKEKTKAISNKQIKVS